MSCDFHISQSFNHSLIVLLAEVMLCKYISMHNISYLAADHFSDVVKTMFPDLDIARDFTCKYTKEGLSYVNP